MSRYDMMLPNLFPYRVTMPKTAIAEVVGKLTGTRTDVPALGSFCVVSGIGKKDGQPTIWLSDTSMRFLTRNGNGLIGKTARTLREAKESTDKIREDMRRDMD